MEKIVAAMHLSCAYVWGYLNAYVPDKNQYTSCELLHIYVRTSTSRSWSARRLNAQICLALSGGFNAVHPHLRVWALVVFLDKILVSECSSSALVICSMLGSLHLVMMHFYAPLRTPQTDRQVKQL